MLERISATNYRSFQHFDISLAPITLFVGPNNSGKSSALSIIRLLSQTLESNDPNVRLLLNGAKGDFGTYKDLIHGGITRKHLEIKFSLRIDDRHMRLIPTDELITYDLHYKYRSSLKEIILKKLECFANNEPLLIAEFNEDSERFQLRRVGRSEISPTLRSELTLRALEVRNFLPRAGFANFQEKGNELSKLIAEKVRRASRNSVYAVRSLQSIEYVGAMRIPPSRTYLFSGERRLKVGANGEHAITMLAMDSMRRGRKSRGIRQNVVNWLQIAGIASDIKIVHLSDRYFEVHIQHPITKEYANFADVGYGNSQVIPVLVAGLNAEGGDTFIVEEPEIHLHPKAQAELGDFFLDQFKRGVQSVIETHSEHMIVRLQRHIAQGNLQPKDVRIYYVHPTSSGKELIPLELNAQGIFTAEWPGGFFPERLAEAKELAIARANQNGFEPERPDAFGKHKEKIKQSDVTRGSEK